MKMNRLWKGIAAAVLFTMPGIASAATVSFNNLTQDDYDSIVKELSSNFYYTTVSGASSLGKTLGFEFGVVGGVSKIDDIHRLVVTNDPSSSLKDKFPHGNLMARLTTPFYGLTAEVAAIPSVTASDAKFSQWGGAVMWTITDVFFTDLPVSLAAKGYYKKTKFNYTQVINNSSTGNVNVNADVTLNDSVGGVQGIVSKKFFGILEPYINLGWTKANGDLDIVSSVPTATFIPSVGSSASSSPTSFTAAGGLDVQLAFFSFGAEAARSFGRNSYTGRVSFRF